MIENKQDYINAISTYISEDHCEFLYELIVTNKVDSKAIRNAAIVYKFDEYRKGIMQNDTNTNIYYQLTADFNCGYRIVNKAVLERRKAKLDV